MNTSGSKYETLFNFIAQLGVKDVRNIFHIIRSLNIDKNLDADIFLPAYGITVGEFAVGYTLSTRPSVIKKKPS